MRNGHIVLGRRLLGSPAWQDGDLWRLWCWCMLSAARKSATVMLGEVPTRIGAGELAASMGVICRGTGLDMQAVRRSLTIGKRLGLLEVRTSPWGLRISIVNWQDHLRPQPEPTCGSARTQRT